MANGTFVLPVRLRGRRRRTSRPRTLRARVGLTGCDCGDAGQASDEGNELVFGHPMIMPSEQMIAPDGRPVEEPSTGQPPGRSRRTWGIPRSGSRRTAMDTCFRRRRSRSRTGSRRRFRGRRRSELVSGCGLRWTREANGSLPRSLTRGIRPLACGVPWSGRRDSNPRPSPWQESEAR